MKRRALLTSAVSAAGAALLVGDPSAAAQQRRLPEESVEALMRARGLEPAEGEPARVRAFLLSLPPNRRTDPRVEPALSFEPELELFEKRD